ncbi:MAG: 3-deoxy-manno-octulosonate cytidylyltransferase [Pseudomonadota bacterium]
MAIRTLIVIPARYASTRFPGKPLAEIAGVSMIKRAALQAEKASETLPETDYVVATDDERIMEHCAQNGTRAVMTDPALASGSDRTLAAVDLTAPEAKFVINLQGDAPFTPVSYLKAVSEALEQSDTEVATPCYQLTWSALDELRRQKRTTPHSGTTCVIGAEGQAVWFSKSILPQIRNETSLREKSALSPVFQHIGLYGFRRSALEQFTKLKPSRYEQIEGLEQLRLLENNIRIECVVVQPTPLSTSGVDTPEDLARLEALIAEHGDQADS